MDDVIAAGFVDVTIDGIRHQIRANDLVKVSTTEAYSGTSYVLRLRNANSLIQTTSGSGVSIVVPPSVQTGFPIPTRISVAQMGGRASDVCGRRWRYDKHA